MKSSNLIRAIRDKWLTEEETLQLRNGASQILSWLQEGKAGKALSLLSGFSSLYIFALENKENRKLTEELCSFLLNGSEFSPGLETGQILDRLWEDLQMKRSGMLLEKINSKTSLSHSENPADYVSNLHDERLKGLYENKMDGQNIDFLVQKLPFPLEVLDPRIVRIPPGKTNELHRHAHETVFIYLQGQGHAKIDELKVPVKPGDFVFIPRWCRHQSVNEGPEEMVFLAVADFGLTGKSFFGNYLKTARLKEK
jgi:hypothetical protein